MWLLAIILVFLVLSFGLFLYDILGNMGKSDSKNLKVLVK
jgi:Flp pilus assembly protein protease CpaA